MKPGASLMPGAEGKSVRKVTDEPSTDLVPLLPPGVLRLARTEPGSEFADASVRSRLPLRSAPARALEAPLISATVVQKLSRRSRQEVQAERLHWFDAPWTRDHTLPGVLIAASYERSEVAGFSGLISSLDQAARRAAATMAMPAKAFGPQFRWPTPLRQERGGLVLVDVQPGSWHVLMTVYGELVSLATSAPVSLAHLTVLAWQMNAPVRWAAGKWRARSTSVTEFRDPPRALRASDAGEPSPLGRLAALTVPTTEAIKAGHGVDLSYEEGDLRLRFITTPPRTIDS
ncbi:MAG: hypothetical protein QOD07_441 [Frankiaceae bacterium]|jgi:hypothetical protein|nr:hypothetical protein [Frankiaceae bacterium]